ncbi:protein artichoke [Leptidea sinapis]|uniref:LRRCT domain-containing protein n=1 Tax=Leptidea sinapis TaxID=189913 RepID=A0A5E4QG50_9NEOP|nr:protein artichoke [Leptidea sinapis]XP_050685513.1 protein artichoke [Leptidea sinapis]VVC97269.1 unnamed protein product [Leptidea sinapis]
MNRKVQKSLWIILLILGLSVVRLKASCPTSEHILPCICTNKGEDLQIWCTHSDLTRVMRGIQKVGQYIKRPIDELIVENNYLPSVPGKFFQAINATRIMLRHNGLERLSSTWLETQESNLMEIYIVENDLKSIPAESLSKLHYLQAITIQSQKLKRIPTFANLKKLKYINIQSESLNNISEQTFHNLPSLNKLFITGSPNLHILRENVFYNLPKLTKLEIANCGLSNIHMRALSLLPLLNELSLNNNQISDATMVGRATRDLPMLSTLNLRNNVINQLNEGAFVDQTMLETLYLANNNIKIIHHGSFHRVPKLRVVDLNYNEIIRIHPESFLQPSGSGVEELTLIGNKIMHTSEFRSLLDALPRLKILDLSKNFLREIPRGALRGHASLELLHLNENKLKFIEPDSFVAMPALRELHLSNNYLSDETNEGPFWNLPSLKGLDLSNNFFQRLQPKLFYSLSALRRINLSSNKLTVIDPITFVDCTLLEYINISSNALVSIHPATFRNLVNLYEIDASSNRLVEFLPGLPRGLENLYLQKNQIPSLPAPPSPDLDLPSLRTLDLSNNGIQKIPYGGMKSLHNLRRFYMKRNGLKQLEAMILTDLPRLEVLDISENQILLVHQKSLSKLKNLKRLNLHGNQIVNFDFAAIKDLDGLLDINISKNKLRNISPSAISAPFEIEILNISSNNLHELQIDLNIMSNIKVFDFSYNLIKYLDENSINKMHMLKELKAQHNKIIELHTGSFKNLRSLEIIDMNNNQIELIHPLAVTDLYNLTSIYLGGNHIMDLPDRVFSNLLKLRVIELQGNQLQFISMQAFDNIPLVQYMNVSRNKLTNLENSGIKHLSSLEVLDLSFNKLSVITRDSFINMEWLVELNLDNNLICAINGQPFDSMSRLKILSLRHNKLTSIFESSFEKLRNNIAILDIDDNPLICNCEIIWLKSWLSESFSIGPKCSDGTHVREMPFGRNDCPNVPQSKAMSTLCKPSDDVIAANLGTSQVFTNIDKIKDYATHIRNHYHGNKIIDKPTPEESEYFYEDYIDYPYNETVNENLNNNKNINQSIGKNKNSEKIPTIYASTPNNNINSTSMKPVTTSTSGTGGLTFFGFPLPSLDMGKLLTTGRKMDWPENKSQLNSIRYPVTENPRFETGGFSPILPPTSNVFSPMTIPNTNISKAIVSNESIGYDNFGNVVDKAVLIHNEPPKHKVQNSTTHKKTKSEVHELQAFLDKDNSTHIAYNRTKNVEEQNSDPSNLIKYNMMESNFSIMHVTEKEGIITTDSSDDMSLPTWLDTTSIVPFTLNPVTTKPPIKKQIESSSTALSAKLAQGRSEHNMNNSRAATITKVNMPIAEHYDLHNKYPPVNREPKTRFYDDEKNPKAHSKEDKDWYYQNYNKSNLEPYIDPNVQKSKTSYYVTLYNTYIIIGILLCTFI